MKRVAGHGCAVLVAALSSSLPACEAARVRAEGICGNGVVDAGEGCDDGNASSGDGCSSTCVEELPGCGDGKLAAGEDCDDGNTVGGDGCSATCQNENAVCGNGFHEAGEQCDDGNTASGDGCSDVCTLEFGCGNDFVEPDEECDDGNLVPGDGCSETCMVEGFQEIEPNDTATDAGASGNIISAGETALGAISTSTDVDCFAFDATAGTSYFFQTFTSLATCAADTTLQILDVDGVTEVAFNDDFDFDTCSFIAWVAPATDRYFVCVRGFSAIPAYLLTVRSPLCGDAVMEGTEQCDDANTTPADGCSDTCRIEGSVEVEPNNDAIGAAGNIMTPGTYVGDLNLFGDIDCYALDATAGVTYIFETTTSNGACSAAATIELFDTDGTTSLAYDSGGGISPCSRLLWSAPATARYFVCVWEWFDEMVPVYFLEARVPVCGDGAREGPEECDDWNTADGDGCSASCAVEGALAEVEANNDATGAANNVIAAGDTYRAAIAAPGDVDCFAFDATLNTAYLLATLTGLDTCEADTTLEILDVDGATQLAFDDDGGLALCSHVAWTAPASGRYFLCARAYSGSATIPFYLVTLVVPIPETEPNDNAAGANALAPGSFYLASISPAGDSDWFAFTATANTGYAFEAAGGGGACPGDTYLEVYDTNGTTLMAADNDSGIGSCSLLGWTAPANGTYYVRASEYLNNDAISAYYLSLSLTVCGDNVVEAGEECDDGGTSAGDGCSATCRVETLAEVEPNNDPTGAEGNPIAPGNTYTGSIGTVGEADCFAFDSYAGRSYRFEARTGGLNACDVYTELEVLAGDGTSLGYSGGGGVGDCALLTWTAWLTARLSICVHDYGDNETIPLYYLQATLP